jgi:hypothetical protein
MNLRIYHSRKIKGQVTSVLRQVTMRIRGRNGLTEREKDDRLGGNVWMMREVTVRMRGQDELTEREDDERSGGNMWVMR